MTVLPILATLLSSPLQKAPSPERTVPLDVHEFRVLGEDYDPENPGKAAPTYYRVVDDAGLSFIRGAYTPPRPTVTLFHTVSDDLRRGVRRLRWRWRAQALPRGGNERANGLGDSAAAVYVPWKRGLRWHSLKFVWRSDGPVGATCNKIRNPFVASDSIVLRSGPGTGAWVDESVDPEALFREHFEGGDPKSEVPELQGIGVMSDGDQTNSPSAADYAGFV